MAAPANNSPWEEIIGDRTAEKMKEETAKKFHKDKKSTNIYQRLVHVNGLFAANNDAADDEEKGNDGGDAAEAPKEDGDHFWKPVECPLEVTNPFDELTKSQPMKVVEHGVWAISAEAGVSTKCNFAVKGSGKWYYEIEVGADPESHDGLNIGFANPEWKGRGEVGRDSNSYGLFSGDGRLYNVQSSYGSAKWKGGDVLGVMVDRDAANCKIEFSLNGESQGVAFEHVQSAGNLFPALTMGQGCHGVFRWKADEVQHRPDGYSTIELADDAKLDDVFETTGPIKVEESGGAITISVEQRGFPTAVLRGCPLTEGSKWYFEFVFGGDSDRILAQIGFGDEEFEARPQRGEGVGDDSHSWGCDLLRLRKWGSSGTPYAADLALKAGDVVGCTLDLDSKTISYSVNGDDLGVAFEGVQDSDGLYPAVSVEHGAVREQIIALYRDQSVAEKKWPDPVDLYTISMAGDALKHRPDGSRLFTDCTVFKAMAICEGLKNYSMAQYKEDFAFMDSVIMLQKDEEFQAVLGSVDESTLVVCDFWATWCGPCVYVAPLYHAISEEFRDVVFLKADVDKLSTLSQEQGIEAMPTFKFYKNKKEVHMVRGADAAAVKEAVQKYSQ